VVVVVDEEFDDDGLLEQAASARAHTGRIRRRIDQVRSALGIEEAYDGSMLKWVFQLLFGAAECQRTRAGTVPITDARSIERRCGQ
jgi:hypothetical protein